MHESKHGLSKMWYVYEATFSRILSLSKFSVAPPTPLRISSVLFIAIFIYFKPRLSNHKQSSSAMMSKQRKYGLCFGLLSWFCRKFKFISGHVSAFFERTVNKCSYFCNSSQISDFSVIFGETEENLFSFYSNEQGDRQ